MEKTSKRLIGLTGGIATGKTTVSRYLVDTYHLPVFDADIYAREAVNVNSPIFQAIIKRYGEIICLENHELNRQKLGEIIFNDLGEKQWLESQIHPYVRQRFREEIEGSDAPVILLDIPLLFESNLTHLVTETWVVYCSSEQQLRRLIERNNLTQKQAIARINSQLPLEEKVKMADLILDNSSTLAHLYQQIDEALIINNY
ncbi:dephospho-CoA kinase [Crocosphaera sp. XPORK-15E]|uniref:dephospho-CoA kinase n=1 Tax=Crocosphaera sp. XPORK-15E TaxID=3110247 RepID=UPI002B1EEB3A|nr:dephospho-CoA kinase [Crocosphaera sp. XPORK-15E]MEA5535885.1 dephospho-CoA kinase [Crocosphaera sp. XPORK-15E]